MSEKKKRAMLIETKERVSFLSSCRFRITGDISHAPVRIDRPQPFYSWQIIRNCIDVREIMRRARELRATGEEGFSRARRTSAKDARISSSLFADAIISPRYCTGRNYRRVLTTVVVAPRRRKIVVITRRGFLSPGRREANRKNAAYYPI